MKNKKVSKLNSLLCYSLYAFCGVTVALPMLFPAFFFLSWIGAVPVIIFELLPNIPKKLSYPSAWKRGFVFFFFYGFIAFSWFFSLYPLDFLGFSTGESLTVVILATTLIPAIQALVSSFIFVFGHFMRKREITYKHPILLCASVSVLVSVSEWLQNFTFLAIPWGKLAMTQMRAPENIQSASLFGSYFVTFLIVFVNCLIALFICGAIKKEKRKAVISLSLAFVLFFSNYLFGIIRINNFDDGEDEKIKVAALQGNIKFEERRLDKPGYTMDVYRTLALSAAGDSADLIVYPETAIPYDFNSDTIYKDYFIGTQSLTGKELIATFFEKEGDDLYNTAHTVDKNGVSDRYYSKMHLVPFGEYLPMEAFINAVCPPLAAVAKVDDPVSARDEIEILETSYGKIGCLICFDSIFDDICMKEVGMGAELLCISTNDSWFEGSVALEEHEFHSILKAVETGKYTVRAANTGISAIISPVGEVITSLGSGERGYITAEVSMRNEKTPYTVTGNIFIPAGMIFVAAFTIFTVIKRKKKSD